MSRIHGLAGAAVALLCAGQVSHAAVTTYNVTGTFNQVVYDGANPIWDTIFTGVFQFDADTMTVTGLQGSLTQAMTGNTASRVLSHQLSPVYDAGLGGLLVSTFHQDSTDVFQGGGFATGGMREFGNENAYVTIFVNTTDPTAALTDAQIARLAYGDCTPGSLMGSGSPGTCMTGWARDTNGVLGAGGTMMGTWPITQTIAAVPEPGTVAMMLAGLGIVGGIALRRRRV